MNEPEDRWFEFVEEYYKQNSVPLSWALIGGGEITSPRFAGSQAYMTTLSKREWDKLMRTTPPAGTYLGGLHQPKVEDER